MKEKIPDDEDMVPGVTHAQYRAIKRVAKRMRDEYYDASTGTVVDEPR